MAEIIFFGNGPLADYALPVLKQSHQIIFHAHTKADLAEVVKIKQAHPDAYGVLASFGVIIKPDLLELFEPLGILNIHPSKLPEYRGPSPIETAILDGAKEFYVSVMKLAPEMDAGPIYYQASVEEKGLPKSTVRTSLPFTKDSVYHALAHIGATLIADLLPQHFSEPTPQDNTKATYTAKFTKADSTLNPAEKTASQLLRQIIAFTGFPKSTYKFNNIDCIIHSAFIAEAPLNQLSLKCADDRYLIIDQLQPAGRKIMNAKSFINGYLRG